MNRHFRSEILTIPIEDVQRHRPGNGQRLWNQCLCSKVTDQLLHIYLKNLIIIFF